MGDIALCILVGMAMYIFGGLMAEDAILTACLKENTAQVLGTQINCVGVK